MSRFSEYLEQVILRSGMKEKELAKASGFARSYIALMKNGQRVSPDTEKMTKLMMALNLPPYEIEVFKEEYHRARVGDEAYERDEAVMEFFHSFGNTRKLEIKSRHEYEIPDVKTVDNRMDLECLIKAVIKNEAEKKDGYIHLVMQGTGNMLKDILPEVCESNKLLEVEHIVCMEQYNEVGSKEDQLYNVKMLKELIPITVFSNSRKYKIYYYYDHVASKFNPGNLLSYMVLTSEYLICMDSNMTMGTISKDFEMRQLYEQLFQQHKKKCREMITYFRDETELQTYQTIKNGIEDVTYSISQQPCFGVLKIDGLIRKYMTRTNRQLLFNLEKMIQKNNQKIEREDNKHIAYCTKKGLQRFAKEGVVDELPKEIYTLLQKQDRKYMLEQLVKLIDEGKYELYLIEENGRNIPKELLINVYGKSGMSVIYLSEDTESRFALNESSLTRTLYESLKNMSKSPKNYPVEESRNYIKMLIDELKK